MGDEISDFGFHFRRGARGLVDWIGRLSPFACWPLVGRGSFLVLGGARNDRHIRGYSERTCPPLPPIAPRRRPFRPHFMHLFRRVLTRSRASECLKANQFSAHLALLVGPEALSHPATAQKSLGRGGRTPPCAPPPAPLRGTWAGLCPAQSPREGV
jgi:hypothetical protein